MTPYYDELGVRVFHGDALTVLRFLSDGAVQCCVTSPPYWGLRDYQIAGQLGLESTPQEYVSKMVEVFREVRRVLRSDGTCWLNLGDSYSTHAAGKVANPMAKSTLAGVRTQEVANESSRALGKYLKCESLPEKNLVGIPWRVAFALQADGWYLRCDIIWSKPNPMPESVTDRPTKAHEYLFQLSKSERYYYDHEAIKEPGSMASLQRLSQQTFDDQTGGPKDPLTGNRSCRKTLENLKRSTDKQRGHGRRHDGFNDRWDLMEKEEQCGFMVNKRSVWEVATKPYPDAHFATFPPKLIEPCILAGSKTGDVILDPFHGAGTTGMVAQQFGRQYIGIELNEAYIQMSLKRLRQSVLPL